MRILRSVAPLGSPELRGLPKRAVCIGMPGRIRQASGSSLAYACAEGVTLIVLAPSRAIDLSEPFVVVCHDRDGGYFDRTHTTYFVNPFRDPLRDVIIAGPGGKKRLAEVAALSVTAFELATQDEYDEFVAQWQVAYETDGRRVLRTFDAGKGLKATQYSASAPILARPGLIVPQVK